MKPREEERTWRDIVTKPSSWWSVEERLPETGTYVVCMAKRNPFSGYMPMVAKILKNGWVNPVTGQYICEVTGWMPMPLPSLCRKEKP